MFKSISTFVVNSYFFKGFYTLLAILVFSIIGLGIYALHTSPYTGMQLSIDNDKWIINRNDLSNPDNSSDVAVGDRVDYLGNILIEKDDFIRLPEFFSKKRERQWWAKQKSFFELLQNSNSFNLRIKRKAGKEMVVTANVLPGMPLHQIIKRNIFIYLSGIFAVGIGGISLFRRPSSPLNVLCAFFSVSGALYLVSVAPVSNRDLTLPPLLFYTLILGCYIGAGGMITLVHFSLLFPRPNLIIRKYPNIIYFLYIYPFITFTFYLSGICAMGAFFPFVIIWILIIVYAFFNSWMSEKDILLKKLISISLIIPVSCSLVFAFIFLLPTFIGLPPLDANYFALISLLIPFSLFFCIENYHLYNQKTKSEEDRQKDREEVRSELHDNLGNDLAIIKRYSEMIDKYLPDNINGVEEYNTYILEEIYESPEGQEKYKLRQQKAELPFGHIKSNLGAGQFMLRGREGVNAEFSILSTCFNISRMITIFGIPELISRLKGCQSYAIN